MSNVISLRGRSRTARLNKPKKVSSRSFNLLRKRALPRTYGPARKVDCKGGPYAGGMVQMRYDSGTLVFTLRGVSGRYDREGAWIEFDAAQADNNLRLAA